jgi:hypothetical protein
MKRSSKMLSNRLGVQSSAILAFLTLFTISAAAGDAEITLKFATLTSGQTLTTTLDSEGRFSFEDTDPGPATLSFGTTDPSGLPQGEPTLYLSTDGPVPIAKSGDVTLKRGFMSDGSNSSASGKADGDGDQAGHFGDSFFDINIPGIGGPLYGILVFEAEPEDETDTKPDLPDRPEIFEQPELPDRPTR